MNQTFNYSFVKPSQKNVSPFSRKSMLVVESISSAMDNSIKVVRPEKSL